MDIKTHTQHKNQIPISKKKPSLGRMDSLRRSDFLSQHKEEEQTWAVSYADFLMVLLSFFVIFFSQDQNKNEIIFKITEEMGGKSSSTEAPTLNSGSRTLGSLVNGFETLNAELKNEFTDYQFFTDPISQSLFIELPDNIFEPGKFILQDSKKDLYEKLLNKLSKYKNEIVVTLIGHSDQSQVRKDRGRKYEDNIELSSLRASNAARKALQAGFSENQIRIKTLMSETRNTRSLTLNLTTN